MTDPSATVKRYQTCRAVLEYRVDMFVVTDSAGFRLHKAISATHRGLPSENQAVWHGLLYAASMLRWRRMTQPQPNIYAPDLAEAAESVVAETKKLRGLVNDESGLDALELAVSEILTEDSPIGNELLASIREVGVDDCVVVANSGRAQVGLSRWLEVYDVQVSLMKDLRVSELARTQSYVVGPPTFFSPTIVTAPITEGVTFMMPNWFKDRSLPASTFSQYADKPIAPTIKIYEIGESSQPTDSSPIESPEDPYYPDFFVTPPVLQVREPKADEVRARKMRMCGKLSVWIDDDERIRTLDTTQAAGSRIGYSTPGDVVAGTYLVLREGQTERAAMYEAASDALQQGAEAIERTQSEWKAALNAKLKTWDLRQAVKALERRGVKAPTRVRAWTDPLLICPRDEDDFRLVLNWIGLPTEPFMSNALRLRRANYKASAEVRQRLELEVSRASLEPLEERGFMRLSLNLPGFRSILVSRVLRVEPDLAIVSRSEARIPFKEDENRWLE